MQEVKCVSHGNTKGHPTLMDLTHLTLTTARNNVSPFPDLAKLPSPWNMITPLTLITVLPLILTLSLSLLLVVCFVSSLFLISPVILLSSLPFLLLFVSSLFVFSFFNLLVQDQEEVVVAVMTMIPMDPQ